MRTFDDTYWGIETFTRTHIQNRADTFDDTYWGIETSALHIFQNQNVNLLMIPIEELKPKNEIAAIIGGGLLMIPIEELKPMNAPCFCTGENAFDDTYWGIETQRNIQKRQKILLLMIPIEELKPQS